MTCAFAQAASSATPSIVIFSSVHRHSAGSAAFAKEKPSAATTATKDVIPIKPMADAPIYRPPRQLQQITVLLAAKWPQLPHYSRAAIAPLPRPSERRLPHPSQTHPQTTATPH